jgi:hypothetical protein
MQKSTFKGHVLGLVWTLCLSAILFCQLNHGRYWWQELLGSFTLYWLPFIVVGLVMTVSKYRRGRLNALGFVTMGALHIAILAAVLSLARPYLYFSAWPVLKGQHIFTLTVMVVPLHSNETLPGGLDAVVRDSRPDVVVVLGAYVGSFGESAELKAFPFSVRQSDQTGRGVWIMSKYPFADEVHQGAGFGALPATYERLRLPEGEIVEIGALSLSPIQDQDTFEDNKLTSRRIATLVRNSSRHRIVVGSFFGSPFSKIVSMYVRQGRLRSVMFGRGFQSTWDMQSSLIRLPADHAFVSRRIKVEEVELFDLPGARHRGMIFKAQFEPDQGAR